MIITQLYGGLGNQMFQYAAGRALALKQETVLKLDVSGYQENSLRQYDLGFFNIDAEIASLSEINAFMNPSFSFSAKAKEKLKPVSLRRKNIRQDSYHFNNELAGATRNTYIAGHWQSEKYFKAYENSIRQDFSFEIIGNTQNLGISHLIGKTLNPVSLHIRRTDYLQDDLLAVLGLDYYRNAMDRITQEIENPCFFVFSDAMGWVKENFLVSHLHVHVTQDQNSSAFEDMRLMGLCDHHIIANSTFSWWGAWLNPDPKKVVVAPKQWFREGAKWYNGELVNTKDLIPEGWIKL